MSLTAVLDTLSESVVGHVMRDVFWMWPLFQNFHFIALCGLFGGLLAIDLRVVGVCRFIPMKGALSLIPFIIGCFAINLITGLAFFCGDPFRYTYNLSFQVKMVLILLAGLNALWFWLAEHKQLMVLADGEEADFQARLIAGLSLTLWVGVIIFGRLIPYLE